ncbi:uncharacterized protein LOC124137708 isoform X1 [Haliotis rufescens]|uniref:uncharacterized protein LOC124137708 isoform X1 n=1 Tax=Haliotis rufescens TaxID=6454 RepID=UPI00201ECB2F|nr:uncharacterized protein LOC124137708 isoform X1 [Haliotis rufescens]
MPGNHFPAICGIVVLLICASSSFINFEPGFEYQYKYDSNANVKNIGDFQVLAKVGYINVGDSGDGQEVYVKVYALALKTKHTEDTIGHRLDFSKWFSFVITPHGEILHVYHPPDDDDEAVAMKKGAAAMFASRLHQATENHVIATDDGWGYHVRETGNEGPHNATYTVRPTLTGHVFTKTRHPGQHPVKHATSEYTKTLYYDSALGTMHTIQVEEKLQVMHKTAKGYNPYENSRPVKAVNNFTEMEYPEMSAKGTGKLVFLSRHKAVSIPSRPKTDITRASIHIKEVKSKKPAIDVKEYLQYVKGNLTCMRNEPEKGSKKLDKCFTGIVSVLQDLPDQALVLLAEKYLMDRPRLTKTFKDQNHMFDAIASLTTDLSQQLLLDLVLNRSRPDSSLVKRLMFHIISLDRPARDNIITKLKSLCFEREKAPVALQEQETYHRMVLALGVVARRLLDAGRKEEAVDIVLKLEGWLGLHDPWMFRQKRSTMTEREVLDDDRWRVILLGSLGNAGFDQSFEMIVSHVNTTNSQWVKRAGIHAMRKYRHEGAAHLMLKTALYDDDEKVRYEALLQYQAHPKAAIIAPMYRQEGPMNGSIFHVDPRYDGKRDTEVHDRHKRGLFDERIEFKLASPSVDWKKMLGSTTIGASFGLIINNALDFKIEPLSGHMRTNIHDEAFARIHLGFMRTNLEFFMGRICFKGGASYNLNMLQEYGVDNLKELVELYDAVKGDAASALETGLVLFKSIVSREFSFADMIEGFRTALEELPEKVVSVGKKASDAMQVLGQLDEKQLPPFAEPARNLVLRITNLYKEVKSSVLSFYNQLMETVTIIIPRAGKMIYKAIKAIIDSFRTFNKDPKQAISTVAGNVITIGLEVKNLVNAIKKTKNTLFATIKTPPDWMNLASQVIKILEEGFKAKKALLEGGEKWIKEVVKGKRDPVAEFSKGKSNATALRQEVVTMLKAIVDDVLAPLEPLKKLGGKFLDTFKKVFDLIKSVKTAYNALKEGYRAARSLIDRVFGPKCHKEFPRTLRLAGGGCNGRGSYPSELKSGKEYEHEGIDVTISSGKDIVAPFAGNIRLSDNPNEVIIIQNAGSLKETEVIITNIEPDSSLNIQHPGDSTYVDSPVNAGQKIGLAANSPCGGNEHIHLALRRKGGYVDPTRYLEVRLPKILEWVQECDDYKVVFKFETIAAGCIICLSGKKYNDTSPKREGEEIKKPEDLDSAKDPTSVADAENEKPDSMFKKMQPRRPQIQEKAKKTKDGALATLLQKAGAFMKKFSIRNLKMGSILDLLEILDLDESQEKIAEVIRTIKEMIDNKPCFNPYQMTDDQLRTELTERGMRANGTREHMIHYLTTPSNSCPLMKISMPNNIYCTFDDKCLGMECCVHFKLFVFRKTYKFYTRFDPCDLTFSVGAGKFNKSFGIDGDLKDIYAGLEKTIPTNVKLDILGGIELVIKVKLEKDDKAALITVAAGFCSQDDHENCIAFFNILDEFPTPLPICHPDGSITWPEVDYRGLFDKESIKRRIRESAEAFAKDAINKGIGELLDFIPCISPDAPGKTDPCPRPEALTRDILKQKLQQRGLQITGTRQELEQRLRVGHKTCRLLNRTVTLPTITNEKVNKIVYMEIAPDCLRIDACVDIRIKKLNFNKAVNAYIQLDPCKFRMTVNFEDCTTTVLLLGYDWGKEKTTKLNDWVSIRYTIDRSEARKVFVIDMGLQISVGASEPILDSLLIEKLDVPIPICNENFSLPGSGSLKKIAEEMGGKLIRDVVDVVFRKLGLDKVLLDGSCAALTPQPDCPWSPPDYKKLLPASFRDNVNCKLPDNCFGVECCVNFSFDIPLFEKPLVKHVPFFLKFEPCNFTVEVGFGSYYHKERLLTYNWGTENQLQIGNGNPSPVIIKFTISKYPKGVLVDLSVHTCIPIDGDSFCYPEGGITLMNQEKIPACDANALVEFTKQNFSVSDWLRDLDLDINLKSLSQAAARILLDKFGISEYLLDQRCDVSRPPYSPSVGGWRNECPKSIGKLPKLPTDMYCHLVDTCTKINCCFHVPFLEMSFNAVLNVDMCDYVINAAIENKTTTIGMLGDDIDLDAGTSMMLDIADVFQIKFGLKKKDKVLLLDLDIGVCLEKDSCLFSTPIMKGTEVPQLVCDLDARWNLKNFRISDWVKARGQDLTKGLARTAVNLLLEQLGINDKMLNPPCNRSSLKYQPADAGNWKNDCDLGGSAITLPPITLPANCHIKDKCLGIDCCLHSNVLDLSLHTTFNIDLCNYLIEGSIEKFSFKHNILNYKWGKEEIITFDGVPLLKLRFKIDRLLSQQMFIVDLTASLCLEGDDCELDLKVLDQTRLPMPGCAKFQGFKLQNFSLSEWLREKGSEITAQLSAVLLEELGIKQFLLDRPCQDYLEPYRGAVGGWNNACPENITLPALPPNVFCHVTDYCTGVTCCVRVSQVKRNFNAYLFLDSCNYNLRVGIEKLEFSHTLFNYTWGETEVIDLGGLVRIEYAINSGQKKFLVNLSLKVCLTAGEECQFTFPVFTDMILPKPFCVWDATKQLQNFSLSEFVTSEGAALADRLTDALVDKLFDTLGLSDYVLEPPCSMDGRGANGWNSDCPKQVSLPTLPDSVSCSLPDHCTGIDCCLTVPLISRNVHFKVDLDMCKMTLTLAIEKLEFSRLLFNYQFGTPESFNVKGIFRTDFTIDNHEGEKQFLVSLNISACFEAGGKCLVTLPVLNQARFPNPGCDWNSTLSLKGFSLKNWLSNNNLNIGQVLTSAFRFQLALALGISGYLLNPMCDRQRGIYKADATGWNNACPKPTTLPTLPDSLSCHIPDYCTGLDCCVDLVSLGMSFNFKILLDTRNLVLTVVIEKLTVQISLFNYKWGEWENFNLNGVVRLSFKIDDLLHAWKYLMSLKLSVCFEADQPCALSLPVFTDISFPKLVLNWDNPFSSTGNGFSLKNWLSDLKLPSGKRLAGLAVSKLLDRLGLTGYLSDPKCSKSLPPYAGAVGGWKKDCPASLTLPTLPDSVTCHLSDPCGSIQCCIDVDFIGRSFNVQIGIDPCTYTFTMGIEKLVFTRALSSYKWGTVEHFNLKDVIRVDFMIDDLFGEKKFLINLNISVCFEEDSCLISFPALKDVKIPKLVCDWDSTAALADFSLSDFLSEMNSTGSESLTSVIAAKLFERLEIAGYLKTQQCQNTSSPYMPTVNGWNKECPVPGLDQNLPELPGSMACHVPDICAAVDCCIYIDFLPRAFNVFLTVDMCTYQLTVGVENLVYKQILFDYQWGTEEHFYVKGVIRVDYTINRLLFEKKLEVTAAVSVCLKQNECLFSKTFLDKAKIPQPLCDWETMLKRRNFSLSNWASGKGLSSTVSSFTDTLISQLLDDLGVSQYLLSPACDQSASPYSPAGVNNWNNECRSRAVPSLPDLVRCHLASNCSTVDCCVDVRLIKRTIQAKFDVDVCNLQLTMTIEKLSYTVSLLEYEWRTEGHFILGDMTRLAYKLKHIPASQKLVIDLNIKMCFEDNTCVLEVPVFSQSELVYSPCSPSLPVPFSGVSFDFWKSEKCALQTSACPAFLPAAISSTCRLTDNCMGSTCCVDVDLKYLGIYSITAGIEVDHCNDQLVYHIENKEWTKKLQAVDYDKNHTEPVGNAITLSYVISKTPSLYEVSFHVKVCAMNGHDLTNNCYYYKLLDEKTFQMPSSCSPVGRRRKRRSPLDLIPTGDAKRILNEAMKQNFTNDEIKDLFDRLKAEAKRESSLIISRTDGDDTATNTKSAIKKMGLANPGTILYSGEVGGGNVVLGMEGGEKIMKVLGRVTDILGRGDQAYTVGKGLTGRGLQLLGAKLANMSIGEMIAMFDAKNIDPELALRLTRQLRDLALALYSEIINAVINGDGANAFSSFDITLQGDFSIPRKSINFFHYKYFFLIGGLVPMTFEFRAQATYGMGIDVGAKILGMTVFGQVVPYGSAYVYGELAIGFILYGKLRFDGYLMNIAFPSRAEIGFYKFPLDLSLTMDMELAPLEMTLRGLVTLEVNLLFVTIKKILYKAVIWRYATPGIRKRLIDTGKKEEDKSPPQFLNYVDNTGGSGRKKRAVSTSRSCLVRQLPDRDYTEPAVEIAIAAQDDRSQVQIFVDAGTKPGLSDVLRRVSLGGPSSIITQRFSKNVYGVPVFFTVYGENSAGARSTVTCSIPTYDVTPPGGRLTSDFSSTSNPAELRGNLVVYEDSDLVKSSVGVGLGRGIYGDEVIAYNSVNLKDRTNAHYDPSSDNFGHEALKHFTGRKDGRLIGPVFAEFFSMNHAGSCVKECMKFSETKCMSVNYDQGPKGHCELLEGIEGHDHKIFIYDQYANFERLGVGLAHEIIYKDLSLRHGVMYYFNIHLINDLQFESILHSNGVLVDVTPPEPGPLANVSLDVLEVTSCESVVPDDRPDWEVRCRGVNSQIKNHRIIHDGHGSKTLFNGDKPLTDLLYTRANRYISANWDGIMDKETGILGYSWTVGRQICEELIHPHHDPHRHLLDESGWTNTGLISPIPAPHDPLPDGKYYITLRALNKVNYGGPLGTTICHTTPLGIDNSPPLLHEIYNISYDEETFFINAQYNASDPDSDIKEVDLCLGQTTRDCHHMDWQRSSHSDGDITRQFQIPGGTPVWIKVRVINNVDLMKVGVSDHPIIVDTSPPEPGVVYDGPVFRLDLYFTKDADKICANWFGFYDPESGISNYELSVFDDTNTTISEPVSLDHKTHETCVQLDPNQRLEHGKAYSFYITAFNAGHKQLNVSAMSDGVIVDLTPPVPGEVVDGIRDVFDDVEFSTHVATVGTQWRNHSDPESDIREYAVQILRAKGLSSDFEVVKDWKTLGKDVSQIEWHNFHLNHQDVVKTKLKTINNALGTVEQTTDGFVVDLTPPRMVFLGDGREQNKDVEFQLSSTTVEANFQFKDDESGLDHYKYQVYELYHGSKHQIYPGSEGWEITSDPGSTSVMKSGLSLRPGAQYSVRVGAVNRAGAVAIYDTNGVLVDNTPPQMKWVYVGIFSGNKEELIDGYVTQSDPSSIKATWFAMDSESAIKSYMVAIGTTQGGTDVLNWKDFGSDRDKYMDELTLTVTDLDTMTPVYYVSVKASNGADLTSDVITSNPIRVVDQDKAGIVIDGADSTERANFIGIGSDMDYQKDAGVVTVQFAGFESHEHGLTYYDWAVGTTPGGEEVQPFIMAGLIHEESETNVPGNGISSMGFGQAVLPLSSGTTYYTTVRGITNAGNILESTSDGFTVDITPPEIHIESYGSENNQSRLTPTTTLYQTEVDSISSSWRAADSESPVKKMYYSVGTYPHGEDVQPRTDVEILLTGAGALPTGIKPTTDGKPNILTLTAENELGLSASIISPYLVVDTSSPTEGVLTCPGFIQPRSAVECTWKGFYDAESLVVEFEFAVGSNEGLEDVIAPVKLPGHAAKYLVSGLADKVTHGQRYYAKVKAINQVGMTSSSISNAINVDTTPPSPGTVVELKSVYIINVTDEIITEKLNTYKCDTQEDCLAIDAVCQESLSTVNVAWQTFADEETEIMKYEIAVGTSPGGGQLRGFFETKDVTKRYLSVTGLILKGVRQIFVTVKATNGAGLSTISTSNGIYMSYLSQGLEPLTHVGIWDGDSHDGDLNFQTSLSRMGAKWDVSGDPCPVVKYEWAIQGADGLRVQEYFNTEGRTNGVNDQLGMQNMERYYQYLRVTNAMDYTYTIRSNGITIDDDPLVPGQVNDGDVVGFDLVFFRTKSKVSANWDKFGSDGNADDVSTGIKADEDKEKSSNQEVAFYEVAVGTDRRFPKTRDDVVPFVNVGLNKTVTFYDLDLTLITAIYYFTVRAHSRSGSRTDVTSNGFSVGFDGGVSAGFIDMKEFFNANTSVDVPWDGFESKIGMMMYYVGLSNNTEAGNYRCGQFTERGSITDDERQEIFNIVDLQNVGRDTFTKFENLSLEQNDVYYAWVVGADRAGLCNVTSQMFQVDVTPPVKGRIRTGPYYDMQLSYSASSESLQTYWTDFSDEDSGIRCYHAALLKRASCDKDSAEETVVDSIEIDVNYTSYKFMGITMQGNTPYFVRLVAENFAGLKSALDSPPVLYDNSLPSSGLVIDGHDFTHDISWSGSANTVTGTFLHHPVPDVSPCPGRRVTFDDSAWKYLESDRNYDSNNHSLTLTYRSANVHPESGKVDIKLSRDTKTDTMFSGTYFRYADLVNGGEYKLSIRAAAGDGQAVTSVLFWDGPDDYILDYDYTPTPDWTESVCACCREEPVNASCTCNCDSYLQAERHYKNISKRSVDENDPGYEVKKLTDEEKKKLQEKGSITGKTDIGNPNLNPRKACGVQLFGGAAAKLVAWCGYGDYLNEPVEAVKDLQHDPSGDYHQYIVKFTTQREGARGSEVTWCMAVYMDGDLLTEQSGIPRLSPGTKLFLGVWNHKNFIPDTDRDSEGHLQVWSATASFRDLVMPADKEKLCRYGNPFQGGNNPIVRYEAGIGSASGFSDVLPYQQVHTPCIPCLTPCDMYTCDPACDSSSTDQVKVTLNNLNLIETAVVEGEVVPVLYYLTVKAVLGSGTEAVSSSDGFNIDTSPPLFDTDVMLYIDVTQGNFTPVTYQGSNDTIKAIWKCNDDESEIMNYEWAIGTAPGGEELQTFVTTGENPGSMNSGLEGLLEHNTTYYVTVRCSNGAGLATTYADPRGVTVLLEPPLVDDVNTTIVGAESLGEKVVPPNSMKTKDKNTVGTSWTVSTDESVRRYDFCVGSSEANISDIFPCTWVGYNTSGTVTVADGYLKLNGRNIYMLSQYKPGYNASIPGTTDKSAFTMAPGTEMFIFMKMCNEAQLCTTKLLGSTLVETDKSTIATSSDGSAVNVDVGGGARRKRDVSGVTVSTPDGLQVGQSIVVTQLTKLDLETEYKSDASVEFVPYITDPSTSTTEDAFTDRILRKRLNYQETDLSLSLSSVGNLPMPGPVSVTFTYDPTVTNTTLMLLHWNTDARQWQQSNKTCHHETDTEVRDPVTFQVTVKVCNTRSTQDSSSSRRRRSVSDTYFRHPTQFLLTSALTEIPNSPPQLTSTTSLVMQEDQGTIVYQMTSTDANGDVVKYKITDNFTMADLELTLSEDGLMTFTPATNYYGSEDVPVILYEVPQAEIPPAETAVNISIIITSVNDAPSAFIFSDGASFLHADPTQPVLILLEQVRVNDSSPTTYRWEFGAYDVDVDDNMTIYYTQPSSGNLTVGNVNTVVPCSYNTSGIPCDRLNLPHPPDSLNWVYRTFPYQPDPGYHGYDEVRVYAQDHAGVYSDVITIKPTVMERPCENGGTCKSKKESVYNCTNYRRAEGFDLYYECACAPGWTGIHCEDDVNECSSSPCSRPYVCYNDVNRYYCACAKENPNCDGLQAWMIGLIVLAGILIIILSLLAWYLCMLKRGRFHWSSTVYKIFRIRPKGSRTPFVNEGFSDDLSGSEKSRALPGASGVFMSSRRPDDPITPMRSERSLRPVPNLHDHDAARVLTSEPHLGEANIRFVHSRHQLTRPDFTRGATTDRPRTPVEDYEERPSSSSSLIRGKSPGRRKSRRVAPGPEPEPDYDA